MPVKGSLPLKVNMAGMIPLIFGQSLLTFPAIVASFFIGSQTFWVANLATGYPGIYLVDTSPWYWLLYFLMVIGFTFFYTDVLFAQQDYGSNLKTGWCPDSRCQPGCSHSALFDQSPAKNYLPGCIFPGNNRSIAICYRRSLICYRDNCFQYQRNRNDVSYLIRTLDRCRCG